jgi:hypothetical protein
LKRFYPPWKLKGNGYIILYKLPREFLIEKSFIPSSLQNKFYGSLSALIIVDYKESNVGSYKEILFIPGLFNFNKTKLFSISKIYVDSESSILNGIENWAIPKEYANFDIKNLNDKSQSISISNKNDVFFKANIKSNIFKIPFNSKIINLSLLQNKNNENFITDFSAKGLISKSQIDIDFINEKFLPDLKNFKPLISFKVDNFSMIFKDAKIFNE